jgi:hypothetical protein
MRSGREAARADLGHVEFACALEVESRAAPAPRGRDAVGALDAIAAAHARGYRGTWTVRLGPVSIPLSTQRDLGGLEDLFVFLLDLVESGFGEWALRAAGDEAMWEGTVHGYDVEFEIGDPDGRAARVAGVMLPKRAVVRLRALVEAGAAVIGAALEQAVAVDASLGSREDVAGVRADLAAMRAAVAELPDRFRAR